MKLEKASRLDTDGDVFVTGITLLSRLGVWRSVTSTATVR